VLGVILSGHDAKRIIAREVRAKDAGYFLFAIFYFRSSIFDFPFVIFHFSFVIEDRHHRAEFVSGNDK